MGSHLLLVPVVGLEPTRYCYQRILSPSRLPIPPHRRALILYHKSERKSIAICNFFHLLDTDCTLWYHKIEKNKYFLKNVVTFYAQTVSM